MLSELHPNYRRPLCGQLNFPSVARRMVGGRCNIHCFELPVRLGGN